MPLEELYAHLKVPENYLKPGELAGSFDHVGLPELLQVLEANKKTGILLVKVRDKKGYVIFSQGKILNCVYDQQEGVEAVYVLVTEKEGQFRFLPREVPGEDKINKPSSELILEASKLAEETEK